MLLLLQLKLSLQRGGRAGNCHCAQGIFWIEEWRDGERYSRNHSPVSWWDSIQHGMRHWSKRQNLTSKGKEIPPERGRTSLGFLGHGDTSGVSVRPKGGQPAHFQRLQGVSLAGVARVTSATGYSSQAMKPQESGCKMEKVTKSSVLFFLVFKQPFILQHSCLKFTELIP